MSCFPNQDNTIWLLDEINEELIDSKYRSTPSTPRMRKLQEVVFAPRGLTIAETYRWQMTRNAMSAIVQGHERVLGNRWYDENPGKDQSAQTYYHDWLLSQPYRKKLSDPAAYFD